MVRKRKKIAEVDWCQYFHRIQGVCPWSYGAWQKEKIHIVVWDGTVLPLKDWSAVIYVHRNASARLLNKLASRYNQKTSNEEWLWSHPQYKENSAPVPCLIQQPADVLRKIRQTMQNLPAFTTTDFV